MDNKPRMKRYLIISLFIYTLIFIMFLVIRLIEYKSYMINFNNKLDMIISKIKEEYPDITDADIMDIINSESNVSSILSKYGIDLEDDSVILENEKSFKIFICIDIICLSLGIILLIYLFLLYEKKRDREIANITKYIEEINKKNYTLEIDEISEDELSILKNEIYKTTVMLKENAENSLNVRRKLQSSLEDISHQLKTPLTSILIVLDNLLDDPNMDDEVREGFIRDLKRQTTSMSFLVQSLLKLSKFDSKTIHFIKEKRLLKELIDESIKNVLVLCDLKNIKINALGNDKAMINCDFMWEVEAITNIVKNCVEHSLCDSFIDIYYEENNVYSSIIIRDYGLGIDKEDLPHIFNRFYKGKNANKDSIGIGLALAKKIIESDNGSVFVDNADIGTKFTIKYFK